MINLQIDISLCIENAVIHFIQSSLMGMTWDTPFSVRIDEYCNWVTPWKAIDTRRRPYSWLSGVKTQSQSSTPQYFNICRRITMQSQVTKWQDTPFSVHIDEYCNWVPTWKAIDTRRRPRNWLLGIKTRSQSSTPQCFNIGWRITMQNQITTTK